MISFLRRHLSLAADSCLGVLGATLSAVLFGFNPLLVHILRSGGMSLALVQLFRFGGGALCYLIIIAAQKKSISLSLNRKILMKAFFLSIWSSATAWMLTLSYSFIPSGFATVLHFSYPLIVTAISVMARRCRFRIVLVAAWVTAFIGIALVSSSFAIDLHPAGIVVALLSAVTFSLYVFFLNDESLTCVDNTVLMFFVFLINALFSFLSLLSLLLIHGSEIVFGTYHSWVFPSGILLSLVSVVGYLLFSYGNRRIGGPVASILSSMEPLTAMIIGIIFLNECIPKLFVLGSALIIISSIMLSFSQLKHFRERKYINYSSQ